MGRWVFGNGSGICPDLDVARTVSVNYSAKANMDLVIFVY